MPLVDGLAQTLRAPADHPLQVLQPANDQLPFQNWGRYKITASLGTGGMGSVYKAQDVRLGRTVAVKFLRSGGRDARDSRQRQYFEREARAQARIDHPHICKISAYYRNSDGMAVSGRGVILSLIL